MRLTRLILLVSLLAGCAARGPRLQQMDADALFAHGVERLHARKWTEAADAFQRFTLVYASHARVAEARYRLGESYMGSKEYVTAALEFNRLAGDYPAGPWADDARFQVCEAYSRLSPKPPLYQEYTRSAIEHCQSLVAYYPDSEYVERARERIDELTNRLAEKDYNTAERYRKTQKALDSAIIYYGWVADHYPTTPWAARSLMRMYEIYLGWEYAQEAQTVKDRLLREHPESPEARQLSGVTITTGS